MKMLLAMLLIFVVAFPAQSIAEPFCRKVVQTHSFPNSLEVAIALNEYLSKKGLRYRTDGVEVEDIMISYCKSRRNADSQEASKAIYAIIIEKARAR